MAAGLGFKEFTTGDVLTAADANGYLASQVVMVFADSAARAAAITSPQEGMITYLKDTNSTEYYSGSAYVAVGASGGMTLISTTALTGASVTTASIAGTYKHLYLVITDMYQATTSGQTYIRFNSDTGSNYIWSYIRNINTTVAGSNNPDTKIQISSRSPSTNTAGKLSQIEISLPRYTDTTPRGVHANAYMHNDTDPGNQRTDATYIGSSAISTITLFGDYNFSGGNLYVYGVS